MRERERESDWIVCERVHPSSDCVCVCVLCVRDGSSEKVAEMTLRSATTPYLSLCVREFARACVYDSIS